MSVLSSLEPGGWMEPCVILHQARGSTGCRISVAFHFLLCDPGVFARQSRRRRWAQEEAGLAGCGALAREGSCPFQRAGLTCFA